jgi:hypothetical protein
MTQDSIALSLVSHTNVGKTTLTRTLLGRDVGEVRDAPHVTEFADAYTLVESAQGERLQLWDTPGFGDSLRLAKRMKQSDQPLGWLLTEVWDRWRDRPFWSSQQALRNVRAEADVVLYLVNAAEEPAAAGYVAPEMELLAWVGKPVIVLLNQMGEPRGASLEAADLQRWRDHLAPHAQVKAVLALDAFARCWVQEFALWQAVGQALPVARRLLMTRLTTAWQAQRLVTFGEAMQSLAQGLAETATARAQVPEGLNLRSRLRQVGAALGVSAPAEGPTGQAQKELAVQLANQVRDNTARLIKLHGLGGEAQAQIMERLEAHFEMRMRLSEGNAALLGGVVTGALTGLKADIASGGLTLGGGMLAGGVLGALGAAGLARGYNLVRGTDHSWVCWQPEALDAITETALLRYLAVAHFGRGRGDWSQGEAPPHWRAVVAGALAAHHEALAELWRSRDFRAAQAGEQARLTQALQPLITAATAETLRQLYPAAAALLDGLGPAGGVQAPASENQAS